MCSNTTLGRDAEKRKTEDVHTLNAVPYYFDFRMGELATADDTRSVYADFEKIIHVNACCEGRVGRE